MASPDLSARLRYLNESAHLLATTAPATSRYLMSRCNSLIFEHNLGQPDPQKLKACGACGTIMIFGWEGTCQTVSQRPRRKKSSHHGLATYHARAMLYICESCRRKTRHQLNIAPPPARHKLASPHAISLSTTNHSSTPVVSNSASKTSGTSSANLRSKKRAKARKHALQGILARQRAAESHSSGFGIDLMDLMKKV